MSGFCLKEKVNSDWQKYKSMHNYMSGVAYIMQTEKLNTKTKR